jgi:L-lysine exporter family protein LysE/ArgO
VHSFGPFASGFAFALSLCLDLGLVNAAVLRTTFERGAVAGFLVGLGSGLGDLVYFTAALLGVAALLAWEPLRWALWLGGTVVLLVLAWRMLREARQSRQLDLEAAPQPRGGALRLVGWGAALALASPSGILWFAAVGASVVAAAGGRRGELVPFGAGFFAGGLAWSAALAGAAAALRRVAGGSLRRWLALASALMFVALALWVFARGLQQLIQERG